MGRYSLQGKTALVTGASSGIGRCLAEKLAGAGVRLTTASRRQIELDRLADRIESRGGSRPFVFPADLSVPGAAAELAEAALTEMGRVDILVNNAGAVVAGAHAALGDGPDARALFELDLWTPLALTSALMPTMADGGVVVNVTSIFGSITWPGFGHYSAAKAALGMATEGLRMERSGVRVVHVVPGPIETDMKQRSQQMFGLHRLLRLTPAGSPEAMADRIIRAIETGKERVHYPAMTRVPFSRPVMARRNIGRLAALAHKRGRLDLDELGAGEIKAMEATGDPAGSARG